MCIVYHSTSVTLFIHTVDLEPEKLTFYRTFSNLCNNIMYMYIVHISIIIIKYTEQ